MPKSPDRAAAPASLHMLKLCVGATGVEDLIAWQDLHRHRRRDGNLVHVTRMWPKRSAELLAGGSLYWVFKGVILARQKLVGFEEQIGADGIRRCALVLAPDVIRTEAAPRRPFQGWRYLPGTDAPRDLPATRADEPELPHDLAAALADLGLR
ncbi:MAG: DUF1489 domain-containing protein [Paracoccaceae bacterium]